MTLALASQAARTRPAARKAVAAKTRKVQESGLFEVLVAAGRIGQFHADNHFGQGERHYLLQIGVGDSTTGFRDTSIDVV